MPSRTSLGQFAPLMIPLVGLIAPVARRNRERDSHRRGISADGARDLRQGPALIEGVSRRTSDLRAAFACKTLPRVLVLEHEVSTRWDLVRELHAQCAVPDRDPARIGTGSDARPGIEAMRHSRRLWEVAPATERPVRFAAGPLRRPRGPGAGVGAPVWWRLGWVRGLEPPTSRATTRSAGSRINPNVGRLGGYVRRHVGPLGPDQAKVPRVVPTLGAPTGQRREANGRCHFPRA
jgi:hypothetical protein